MTTPSRHQDDQAAAGAPVASSPTGSPAGRTSDLPDARAITVHEAASATGSTP